MDSVAGSRSLKGGSDELYDLICGPCQTDNLNKQANHYCNECRDFLCNSCKDVHRKLAILKSHTILSGKQIPTRTPGKQRSGFAACCSCDKNQQVEFFCESHQEVICNPCKKVKHRSCKTVDVQEKSAGYSTAQVNSMLAQIKSMIHDFDTMQKQRESNRKELKRLKEDCIKKIKYFRATIDAILDNLEKQALDEVDEYDIEQNRQVDQNITVLTTGLHMLDADKKQLEDSKANGNKVKMFITDVQVSKSLKEYEAMLAEMENDVSEPTLSFEVSTVDHWLNNSVVSRIARGPGFESRSGHKIFSSPVTEGNKKLDDFLKEITSLGKLNLKRTDKSLPLSASRGNQGNKKQLLGKKATLKKQVSVKLSEDNDKPRISGCTFMPSGHAELCDTNNKTVKLLDKDLVLRQHLKLCYPPWDVSVIDDNNVIITLLRSKQLQNIQVFPQLKVGRTIQLDKTCYGIEVFGDEIYTTQCDGSGQGEVQVLHLNGNRKRKLQTGVKFYCPCCITVSSSGKKIFVSDGYGNTATVTCITTDGNLVYQYKHKELRDPRGMYVDAEDNILVCDWESDTLQMITANGKKYGTLLSSSDGIDIPRSIAYRETDDTLLVGCEDRDLVSSYKLV